MPCYLFTYHTYGSWLPDHRRGYVQRHQGSLPTNTNLAQTYRQRMKHTAITLSEIHQQRVIETTRKAAGHIACRLHFIATDPTRSFTNKLAGPTHLDLKT